MKRILIVDDETLLLCSLSKGLIKDDVEVKGASTGKEALREIRDHQYNVCLLDIGLPDITGLDIMKTVKKIAPECKVIIMTANEIDSDMMKDIREHACFFLPKPFELAHARSVIDQILGSDMSAAGQGTPPNILQKRKYQRIKLEKTISCTTVGGTSERIHHFQAQVVDISIAGIGISTDQRVGCGLMIRFSNGIDHSAGVVKWCSILENNAAIRAGIQFI